MQRPILNQHILELDGIRGYACLCVLIEHCLIGILQPEFGAFVQPLQKYLLLLMVGGVDCFFVLSGFLIGGILMDSRHKPHYFKKFWIRRIARIFPVLYILLFTYAIALWARATFELPQLDLWLLAPPIPPFWSYATFTQSFPIAEDGFGGPRWVGITWSLAIEEQFYLIFPFIVFFLSRRWLVLLAIGGIVASPFLWIYLEALYNGSWYSPYVLLPARMGSLMAGVLVAIIVRNDVAFKLSYKIRWLLDGLALFLLYLIIRNIPVNTLFDVSIATNSPIQILHFTNFSILFGIMVLRVFLFPDSVLNRLWRTKFLMFIGVISYGLYMYHQAINGLVHGFIFNQEPKITNTVQALSGLIVILAAILVARFSYFRLEKPIRNRAHQLANTFT